MIDFSTVSREIRSLISRRQELTTFLGSLFAATGIFLQNALGGNLPDGLADLERHLFFFYALMLMAPSLVIALRIARLHGGMVLNGMLYARLMSEQSFTTRGSVERAAAHNFFGVSFLQFLLADFIAAFSLAVLVLTTGAGIVLSVVAGVGLFGLWLALHFRFRTRAIQIARRRIADENFAPVKRAEWEEHASASLHDANHELIGLIALVGLITFSVFEVMSGLGHITVARAPDLRAEDVRHYGPGAYTFLMLVTCLMGAISYLRIRVAIGRFSLELDPTDRPFRPLVLTDSFLGYLLVSFLLAVAVHLSLIQFVPSLDHWPVLVLDALILALAVLAEQLTLVYAGRHYHSRTVPIEFEPELTVLEATIRMEPES